VFPNAALITATFQLGDALDNAGLHILGCVMAALLVIVWALVFVHMLRSMWRRELLWPCDRKLSTGSQM
jgi:tellurite resistance protein TehA-like permease